MLSADKRACDVRREQGRMVMLLTWTRNPPPESMPSLLSPDGLRCEATPMRGSGCGETRHRVVWNFTTFAPVAVSDMHDLVAATIRATCDAQAIGTRHRRRSCELSRPISVRVSAPAVCRSPKVRDATA